MTETAVRPTLHQLLAQDEATEEPAAEEPIDEELLEEAMRGVGTSSRNAAINAVLREYVMAKRKSRREALESLQQMSADGLFDYSKLDEIDE